MADKIRMGIIGTGLAFERLHYPVSCFPCEMTKNGFARTEWRQHPDYPGGDLLDAGVHDLAGLRHIFGPVERVHAFGRRQDDDFSPCAVFNVNLRFRSGVTGQFSFDAGREPHRPPVGLRIFGTGGEIYLEERDAGVINVSYNDGRSEQIRYTPRRGYYSRFQAPPPSLPINPQTPF